VDQTLQTSGRGCSLNCVKKRAKKEIAKRQEEWDDRSVRPLLGDHIIRKKDEHAARRKQRESAFVCCDRFCEKTDGGVEGGGPVSALRPAKQGQLTPVYVVWRGHSCCGRERGERSSKLVPMDRYCATSDVPFDARLQRFVRCGTGITCRRNVASGSQRQKNCTGGMSCLLFCHMFITL